MNHSRSVLATSALALTLLVPRAEAAFQVVLEVDPPSGASATFTDGDLDGIIDFNTTVGGVFLAQGQVKQNLNPILQVLAIAPTPPAPNAILRNVDTVSHTFRVTVTSDPFPTALAPPLGWNLFYNATVDDALSGVVNVPSNGAEGRVNAGAALVGSITGPAIAAPTLIDLEAGAVDTTDTAPDMTLVLTFTADPQDEFLVPTDDGFDGTSIQFEIFNTNQQCVDKMNNDARIVADKAWKSDFKCIRLGESSDVTTCVDNPEDEPTEKKNAKLVQHFPEFCPAVPPWGVNRLSCCDGGTTDGAVCSAAVPCGGGGVCTQGLCIGVAAENGINELTHALFGATVMAGADAQQKCQQIIQKFAGRLFTERWKTLRLCKRDSFASILSDADLVTTCLGPPQPDPKDKIAKRQEKLALKVQKLCIDEGVTPVGAAFPGDCTAVADGVFDECVGQRTACAFCRAINRADAIVPPADCDLFDDGVTNASCAN
jgi:hypothetical protein